MTEQRELSASALQIQEKKQRMNAMLHLASETTAQYLKEIVAKNPSLSKTQLIERLKKEGILKFPFLHSYVKKRFSVELKTAKGYYAHFSQSLKPDFIEFQNVDNKPCFRLSDKILEKLIREPNKEEESQ